MTKVLAIETATPGSSVALGDRRSLVASAEKVDARGHTSFIVSAMDFLVDQAGWSPSDIDAIAVDVGPGLYTGIRVGLASAQGLAATLGVPLVPVSSLDVLALQASTGRRQIWSIVDVRRNEVAVGTYRPVPGGVVKDGIAELMSPDEVRAGLESINDDVLLVGEWSALGEDVTRGLHRVRTGNPRYPHAEAMLELAVGRLDRDEIPHPDEVRPLYLREPDVTINWDQLRRQGPWESAG